MVETSTTQLDLAKPEKVLGNTSFAAEVRYVCMPMKYIHTFSGGGCSTIKQFSRDVLAAWRTGMPSTEGRVDLILNITPRVGSALRFQSSSV